MALTVNKIPRYKGLSGSDPQIQDSNLTDDGVAIYSELPINILESTEPATPGPGYCKLYVDSSNSHLKIKNDAGTVTDVTTGGGGASNWGDLGGTLSDQTDLQAALDAKQGTLTNSAGLRAALSDETGTGAAVFATSPTLVTPILGTPTSGTLTNCTGLPIAGGGTGAASAQAAIDALTAVSSATNEHVLTKDTASGNAIWKAASGGYITESGTTDYLTTTTNDLVIGASSPISSAKFSVDGDADQIQTIIQGHSTQTGNILEVQKSDGTVNFSVSNTAGATIGGSTAQIADTNGNELIKFTATASAVNEITLANGATGNNCTITASGETNTGITITGKGTKGVSFGNAVLEKVTALSDGATPALDASLGNFFTLTAAGNRTIAVASGTPPSGYSQKIVLYHTASGGDRTLAFNASGYDTTGITIAATTSGKTDAFGLIWNNAAGKFYVVAQVQGYA